MAIDYGCLAAKRGDVVQFFKTNGGAAWAAASTQQMFEHWWLPVSAGGVDRTGDRSQGYASLEAYAASEGCTSSVSTGGGTPVGSLPVPSGGGGGTPNATSALWGFLKGDPVLLGLGGFALYLLVFKFRGSGG